VKIEAIEESGWRKAEVTRGWIVKKSIVARTLPDMGNFSHCDGSENGESVTVNEAFCQWCGGHGLTSRRSLLFRKLSREGQGTS
jgi:hypothetical protein